MILKGTVWKFGDNVTSNYFLSGKYDGMVRAGEFDKLVPHVLEDVMPDFASRARPGDIIVAGRAFGTGKHLEGLVGAFKAMGLGGVVAQSFAAAWERDAINLGLPSVICPEVPPRVQTGDRLELDLAQGLARLPGQETALKVTPTPAGIISILQAGGLEAYTLQRLGRRA
jgi:3-isopropylmalate dehydratase, small subunit